MALDVSPVRPSVGFIPVGDGEEVSATGKLLSIGARGCSRRKLQSGVPWPVQAIAILLSRLRGFTMRCVVKHSWDGLKQRDSHYPGARDVQERDLVSNPT
jgi:hypothetical protein